MWLEDEENIEDKIGFMIGRLFEVWKSFSVMCTTRYKVVVTFMIHRHFLEVKIKYISMI